jgi:hypothetical protein
VVVISKPTTTAIEAVIKIIWFPKMGFVYLPVNEIKVMMKIEDMMELLSADGVDVDRHYG